MNYEWFLSTLQQFGYAALFFMLWLGIVGIPIPAFILTYLGVVSGLTLGYLLGRYAGTPILTRLRRKKKMEKYLRFS